MIPFAVLLALGATARAGDNPASDFQALPHYLTEATVLGVLHEASSSFTGCFGPQEPGASAAIALELRIDRSGAVSHSGTSGPDGQEAATSCVQQRACGLSFPAHDEPHERWSYTVTWAGGQVHPYPRVSSHPRPRGPLFLLLPSSDEPERQETIRAQLGFDPTPAIPDAGEPNCPDPRSAPPVDDPAGHEAHEQGEL